MKSKKQNTGGYALEDTILMATRDKEIEKEIKKIGAEMRMHLYTINRPEDLVAVPCIIVVTDQHTYENEQNTQYLKRCVSGNNINEWQIWFFGESKAQIPAILRSFSVLINHKKDIKSLLQKRKDLLVNQNVYPKLKTRLHRIIDLYKCLREEHHIQETEYCKKHGIHKRTLQRDIALLRDVKITVGYDGFKGTYTLLDNKCP
jgi:hypothetical protein